MQIINNKLNRKTMDKYKNNSNKQNKKKEFLKILSLYKKWVDGEIERVQICKDSMNTSYIFGIINGFDCDKN